MIHRIIRLFVFFSFVTITAGAQHNSLEQYVQQALDNNLALQQKGYSYEKSLAALKEARQMFLPQLSLEARYSLARGGRTIDIPVGDLVNPAYQNLNLLNNIAHSASPDYPIIPEYPTIPNESINFLRESEQETKVRVAMPVFNNSILHNHRIKQHLTEVERTSVDIYRQELIKEVKTAYYNYGKAEVAVGIYENALALTQENLRTTESLQRNHKVTMDVVYQARAEVEKVRQQLAEAIKNKKVAQAYFNFLLNRDYTSEINIDPATILPTVTLDLEEAQIQATHNRQELQQLNHYLSVADDQVSMNKGSRLPQVNLVVDYGIQGTGYDINRDADFVMGSVVMSWSLFNAPTGAKVQQSRIAKLELEKKKEEAQRQIGLQVVQAYYAIESAQAQIDQAEAEAAAAERAYELVEIKYRQGQANLIELTNARTQWTNAQESEIIAHYDLLIRQAELERATAQ
ncbi:MAG: TolC family protein [Saprospiraceae bacterium]|nr:TolC family protein [Lewinella sp.]